MPIDVFVSVGRTSTHQQEAFVRAVEDLLLANSFNPYALGRNEWSSEQPLRAVSERMEQCNGAVVIAFERTQINHGVEKRGSLDERALRNEKLPTVWNQIEATMAYVLGYPLLVIVEEGLKDEGLLEARYDWYVQHVLLSRESLATPEFQGIFADWKKRVERQHVSRGKAAEEAKSVRLADVEKLTLGQILNALTIRQLWAVISAIVGALAAVATVAFMLGRMIGGGS